MKTEDRGTVLIVDDDPNNLKVLNDVLENAGFQVLLAEDGLQCLESAELGQPDAILLDIVMPGIDGHETCRRLKKNPKTRDIPVIFLSALADPENILNGFDTGGVDYIGKPFHQEEVLARVTAHVTLRRQQKALMTCNLDLETQIQEIERMASVLAESEARSRALLEAIPDLMFRLDRNGVFLDYKADPENLHAQEPETLVGKRNRDLVPAEFADLTDHYIEATLRTGKMQVYEFELSIPGQGMRDYEARMVKSGNDEVTAIVRDMTDRKRLEQERLQMERRLQTAHRLESLGAMAGGIAHDFNNSLMVALGYLEMAREETEDVALVSAYLDQCDTALKRPVSLTQQMLDYSGKGYPAFRTVDLESVIQETDGLLTSAIPENISLLMNIEPNLPKIQGNASQLQQILTHLVVNAAESYDEQTGGEVTLSAGTIFCDEDSLSQTLKDVWLSYETPFVETDYVYIDITDTGCGMDSEVRKRIFEPFFSTKFVGRGLGLAAVFGIIRGHRGYIRVDSRPNQGTTVRVMFPVAAITESPEKVTTPATAPLPRGTGHILLVEDEEPVREMVRRMLTQLGYSVISSSSGSKAVRIFRDRKREIDLVLCDMRMPGIHGVELLRKLRGMDDTVPVILTSGYSTEDLRHRYETEGFAGFLQKPFRMAELGTLLQEVLQKNRISGSTQAGRTYAKT
ncbi:MAG: response regulator [Thermodesulfobacteriota bacterium]